MKLRIATLNIWALPLGLARHAHARFAAIADHLAELELDAIGFQEVWREDAREALIEGGRRAGLVHHWDRGATTRSGGLMLLSRHPIHDARFETFSLRGLPQNLHHGDYHSGKGFALARLETPGGPLTLVDTHLIAQYAGHEDDHYHPHRVGQIVEIGLGVRDSDAPLVAVGDFNMREDRPEHRVFTALSGLEDVAAALDGRQPTSLSENPYRGDSWSPAARIDYVFSRPGRSQGLRPLSVQRIFDAPLELEGEPAAYSDHAGVLVEFELGGDGAPLPGAQARGVGEAEGILRTGRRTAVMRRGNGRITAGAAGVAASLGIFGLPSRETTRRGFLGRVGLALGWLAVPVGAGALVLSEHYGSAELDAFDAVLSRLRALRRSGNLASRAAVPGGGGRI